MPDESLMVLSGIAFSSCLLLLRFFQTAFGLRFAFSA